MDEHIARPVAQLRLAELLRGVASLTTTPAAEPPAVLPAASSVGGATEGQLDARTLQELEPRSDGRPLTVNVCRISICPINDCLGR